MDFDEADALNEAIRAIGIRHRALAIDALAPFGIHPGHKLLLLELETEGPRTQAQLAAACGYEPPTITLSVRQLETAGLVVRRSSPTDGRATISSSSVTRRALLPQLKDAWRQVAAQAVAGQVHLCRTAHGGARGPGRQSRRRRSSGRGHATLCRWKASQPHAHGGRSTRNSRGLTADRSRTYSSLPSPDQSRSRVVLRVRGEASVLAGPVVGARGAGRGSWQARRR